MNDDLWVGDSFWVQPQDLTDSWARLRTDLETAVYGGACAVNVSVWAANGVALAIITTPPAKIAPRRNLPEEATDWWNFIRSLRASVPPAPGEYLVMATLMANGAGQPMLWTYPVAAAVTRPR